MKIDKTVELLKEDGPYEVTIRDRIGRLVYDKILDEKVKSLIIKCLIRSK